MILGSPMVLDIISYYYSDHYYYYSDHYYYYYSDHWFDLAV